MNEIPKYLRHLPTYRGLPIPFTQFITDDGEPDFKCLNDGNVEQCLKYMLCAICGRKLKDTFCFIGGEKSIANKMFTDPAMHSDCARYAAKTCPYLNGEKRRYSKAPSKAKVTAVATLIDAEGIPKRLGIYYTNSYTYGKIDGRGPMLYVTAGPQLSVDWNAMPETPVDEWAPMPDTPVEEIPSFPDDQFDALMGVIPNNEGVVFLDEVNAGGHILKKITADDLRTLDTHQRFNVICPVSREIMSIYSQYLEHTYFPPGTPLNNEMHLIFFKWQDMLWGIISVPMARREWCFEAAEKCGLRLANGTPRILGNDLDDPISVAKFLPIEIGIALGGKLDGASFPLESERTWTLEPIHEGAIGPVLSVMVEKQR